MRISQVTPGLLPIPPNGWGAVEKIIWEYHQNTIKLGHQSEIKYLNEITPDGQDVVHIHVANLALMAQERGIPYVFSMHDHHAYLYGKDSPVFQENYNALKGARLGLVPAKYLVDYFDLPNVQYLSHGVNTDFFTPGQQAEMNLLCVANNGFIHDQSEDRKGFLYAIQAAKALDLPITVAGPSNNKNFFERYPQDYSKLEIKYDLTELELKELYQKHSIFVHASNLEAGHPNLTLLEAMSSGLPVAGTFELDNQLPGLTAIERSEQSTIQGIEHILENYNQEKTLALKTAHERDWFNITQDLINRYSLNMKDLLAYHYKNTKITRIPPKKPTNRFIPTFINGAKLEVLGPVSQTYHVKFIDLDTGNVEYTVDLANNTWGSPAKKYHVNWRIEVWLQDEMVYEHNFDPQDRRVYIALDSRALGDTLAWMPYVEEYRKKHNCKVVCSTFQNYLFESEYPEIEFVSPGNLVHNLYAMYTIGWFCFRDGTVDLTKNKNDFKTIPLQQASSDFLGIPFSEIRPKVAIPNQERTIEGKYVCIAPHASAHAKYWQYDKGWQGLIDYLNDKGYKVVMITHEPLGDVWHDSKLGGTLTGVINKTGDIPLQDRINDIKHADMFIGLSSGLSWLSWAVGTQTTIISGFTDTFLEPQETIRLINESVCHGCSSRHILDAGDWQWCPDQKGTPRQFECSKAITLEDVISKIDAYL